MNLKWWLAGVLMAGMILAGILVVLRHPVQDMSRVASPESLAVPLRGVYTVTGSRSSNAADKGDDATRGKIVTFGSGWFTDTSGDAWQASWSTRKVSLDAWLFSHFRKTASLMGLSNEDVMVATAQADEGHSEEWVILSDRRLLYARGASLDFLEQTSETASSPAAGSFARRTDTTEAFSKNWATGVLLGLWRQGKDGAGSARTIWIAFEKGKISPVLEMDGILLPRKTGFWKVTVNNGPRGQTIAAGPVGGGKSLQPKPVDSTVRYRLLYAGNDFLSVAWSDSRNRNTERLAILPVDGLPGAKPMSVTDLFGSGASQRLQQAVVLNNSQNTAAPKDQDDIGLLRRNGRWSLVGRNHAENGSEDFPLLENPVPRLVLYDSMALSWAVVKSAVPDATDVFFSPGKEVAVITAKNTVQIWDIRKGALEGRPLARIHIDESDTAFMSEWCSLEYVQRWQDVMKQNGGKPVSAEVTALP